MKKKGTKFLVPSLTETAFEFEVVFHELILFNNLDMKHVASGLVPKDLQFLLKCIRVIKDILERVNSEPTFN